MVGFQPSSAIFLMVCAANFGVAKMMTTSGLSDFILTMWESTVGSVSS
jgi:hypothetical protein